MAIDDIPTEIRELVKEEVRAALADETVRVERQVIVVDPRRLYSVAAVAELLGVSKVYVYDRIKAGEIAVVELGGSRPKQRVSVSELERFIDARTFGRTAVHESAI